MTNTISTQPDYDALMKELNLIEQEWAVTFSQLQKRYQALVQKAQAQNDSQTLNALRRTF